MYRRLDWSVETLIKSIAWVHKSYFKDKKDKRPVFPKVWSDVNGFLVTLWRREEASDGAEESRRFAL